MQDRFKFRVFLKYNQAMYNIDSFCYLEGLNKSVFHFKQGGQKTLKNDDFVLMQCTGLKDKNGKLIYEGDIVKSFHVSSTMQGRVFIGFVIYDDERCRYCILENKHCGYVTFSNTDDVFEVIGNIYENKELLNENI